ncbi:fimbrial protein [Serratia proteamaculans]|jgi:type 1 fimbria pilin|uniref:fimbrial protein n=1 Tax=Serratia proteamaculans TaxID=28151 RepID=UPI0021790E01|nr:fimbrial protein [Serratia proteamaculans]CAI0974967.1 putative minor fimbrial subunit StfF [Serratia proteamaculans]CAI1095963.1 putative minor fimbrial subunit StfF [Serratia proteamaculans]CAI1130887.1 putative minor fimbrial subunit StfF [Serratia proteamaculans]CAI1664220.1 putative minor fimbrial subunit StfF [Serratia proteamaculans]CAI2490726.1 putative minor fimbrial subunit StfF [Serratia proteamaculans]
MNINYRLRVAGALVMALIGASTTAAENMSFRGTLLDTPPCTITVDGEEGIEIDFGQVGVNKVNGENYKRSFILTYECEGTSTDKLLRYLGIATAFDPTAVQSNLADFGIGLQHQKDGVVTPFKLGSTLTIPSYLGSTQLIAAPVKKAGANLREGPFSAAATFQLEYP